MQTELDKTPQNFNKKLQRGTVSSEEMAKIAEALDVGYEQAFDVAGWKENMEKCNRGVLRVDMALSKSDFEKLDSRLKNIIEQPVEQIEVNSDLPPTIEQLEDNNKTYSIVAAILFIDIRKSTYLTENSQAKTMVKIYTFVYENGC